jgi:mycoredoxin
MSDSSTDISAGSKVDDITLYVSNWCSHSRSVEKFLENNDISVHKITIDGDDEARAELIKINDGYASVPTLVFPDGSRLTEPSLNQLRHKLGVESQPGLMGRIRGVLGGKDAE